MMISLRPSHRFLLLSVPFLAEFVNGEMTSTDHSNIAAATGTTTIKTTANTNSSSLKKDEDEGPLTPPLECHIWLGPSTIEGAGLGMFAGRDFHADEVLAEDIVIPIYDIMMYNNDEEFSFLWDGESKSNIVEDCQYTCTDLSLDYHIVNLLSSSYHVIVLTQSTHGMESLS
jgi:hypothetical protein